MWRKPWEDGSTSEAKRQQHIAVRDLPATRTSTRTPPIVKMTCNPLPRVGVGDDCVCCRVKWRPARVQCKPPSLLLRAIETYFSNILLFYWSSFTNIFAGLWVVLRLRNRNLKKKNTIFLLTFNYFFNLIIF